jgi:hypothetical protein
MDEITDAIEEVNRIHMLLLFDQKNLALQAELKRAAEALVALFEQQ